MMLSRVCCIIDTDGFDIKKFNKYGRYSNEFLVREFGYIGVSPDSEATAKSYRFDLRQKIDLARISPEGRRTLNYQSRNVVGLTILPRPEERDAMEYDKFNEVVTTAYGLCRTTTADVVAYKGGDKERKILDSLNIPSLDLQEFGCPPYRKLIESGEVYSVLRDCGHHTEFRGASSIHCPIAEVTAYRDWYMKNYKRFENVEKSDEDDDDGWY